MKDKEKQFIERIECGNATIFEDNDIIIERGNMVDMLNQEQAELEKATIEELTRNVADYTAKCNALCNTRSCYNCDLYGWKMDCHNVYIAKGLYEQGYRKITDSVVLSRKECEAHKKWLKELAKSNKEFEKIGYEKGSKETAEKIFAKIDEELAECTIVNEGGYGWNYQGYEATDLRKRLTKLAKSFGVEIKE